MENKILVITGTTASGKTKLAIEKAKELNGEIISADSRQLYRYLDIVTGKDITDPNFQLVKELPQGYRLGFYLIKKIPVWLYDIIDPNFSFSAYDWSFCARQVIKMVMDKGKLPILVGGSYFYLHTLLYGLSHSGNMGNMDRRRQLEKLTVEELQTRLKTASLSIFQKLNHSDKQNKRRLIRWLEKAGSIHQPVPSKEIGLNNQYEIEIIGLRFADNKKLKERIKSRVEQRLIQGALEETELLLKMGYTRESPGLQTLGYQQLLEYLNDEISLGQAKDIWINKERQYAKRQTTFMKKNPTISWIIL